MSSIKDKNVFNYKDKIVLKLQEQKCPQIMRITMSLITRTKMSSNYKDKNVLNCKDKNVLKLQEQQCPQLQGQKCPQIYNNVLNYKDKNVLKLQEQ
ncbi:unnamed protein product [Rhizophagus irregularis]|nr:unnamed protein product [Rhizophagus irregularis]CAB4441583.1 unnamed protein product [Rhizophagus irregularis]CAB4441630.1 unnamed protein product [Rhizophagus irregularis]